MHVLYQNQAFSLTPLSMTRLPCQRQGGGGRQNNANVYIVSKTAQIIKYSKLKLTFSCKKKALIPQVQTSSKTVTTSALGLGIYLFIDILKLRATKVVKRGDMP